MRSISDQVIHVTKRHLANVEPAHGIPPGYISICPGKGRTTLKNLSKVEAKRYNWTFHQFPIILAYAITDYKIQGQTFDKVILDLRTCSGRPLSNGSAYVMMSRVKSLQGLAVLMLPECGVPEFNKVPTHSLMLDEEVNRHKRFNSKTSKQCTEVN